MSDTGFVILDNNVLRRLEDPDTPALLQRSLRSVDLEIMPTEVNFIEATKAGGKTRATLLRILRGLAEERGAVPWTPNLLQSCAEGFLAGTREFTLPMGSYVQLTDDALDAERPRADKFCRELDRRFADRHAKNRPKSQATLKRHGLQFDAADLGTFLDDTWTLMPARARFADYLWRSLRLPEPRPPTLLDEVDAWRLIVDAEGAAMYNRALVTVQPRQVQWMDLQQLPYLGGRTRQILVTRDGPFFDLAAMLLRRRYPLRNVTTIDELLAAV